MGKKAVHNCFSPYKQMTLSEIYFWIMSTFPYYKANRYMIWVYNVYNMCNSWKLVNYFGDILDLPV